MTTETLYVVPGLWHWGLVSIVVIGAPVMHAGGCVASSRASSATRRGREATGRSDYPLGPNTRPISLLISRQCH